MFHNHMPQHKRSPTIQHQLLEIKNQSDKLLREISQIKEIVEQLKDQMVVVNYEESRKPLETDQEEDPVQTAWRLW
jgi:hypothetical protein